jgi:prolyl-tRNA synthetase
MEKEENFSDWFDKVLLEASIVDGRYPVKGFTVYRGWGYRIVRGISRMLEERLEEKGHEPMLFPVVIPEETFEKEAEHIKGFASEVFWITRGGDTELPRKLLLRPTSETAIYPLFKIWIRSHADLPMKMHQTCTIYRYETKATRHLFRAREFLWNEAHTAHASEEEAEKQVLEGAAIYSEMYQRLGLGYVLLRRPDFDKFHGAVYSIAFDAWNPDGKVNQIGTVHNLGDKFAKAFEITYENENGDQQLVYQTCYGFGVGRVLAGIVAQHGDDHGLVLPPEVAPLQVVIVPIPYKGYEEPLKAYCTDLLKTLQKAGIRSTLDDSDKMRPGEKFYHWEMLGVPLRLEVGPREMERRASTLVRRDTLKRTSVQSAELIPCVQALLNEVTENLRRRSKETLEHSIREAQTLEDVRTGLDERRMVKVNWCEDENCALQIKEEIGGEIRGYRFDINEEPEGPCILCGRKAEKIVYVSRTY